MIGKALSLGHVDFFPSLDIFFNKKKLIFFYFLKKESPRERREKETQLVVL